MVVSSGTIGFLESGDCKQSDTGSVFACEKVEEMDPKIIRVEQREIIAAEFGKNCHGCIKYKVEKGVIKNIVSSYANDIKSMVEDFEKKVQRQIIDKGSDLSEGDTNRLVEEFNEDLNKEIDLKTKALREKVLSLKETAVLLPW